MLGPKNVTIHGDIHTKITYIGLERDRYGKTLLKFSVENKTDVTLTYRLQKVHNPTFFQQNGGVLLVLKKDSPVL